MGKRKRPNIKPRDRMFADLRSKGALRVRVVENRKKRIPRKRKHRNLPEAD